MEFVRKHAILFAAGVLVGINLIIWQQVYAGGEVSSHELKVFYLDIGQGDATFIEAPNGNQMLIDGGRTDNKVLQELGEVMPVGDRSIDVVLATHPDADHIGGLPEVLKRYDVQYYFESGNETKDTGIFKTLEKTLEETSPRRVVTRRGERITLDSDTGVYVDVLYPDRDVSKVESNDASFVGKLTYGETCFIFSGDASQNIERYILKTDSGNLNCQVLKTGHHGSKTATSPEWAKAISPQYAVISAGKDNTYGHPNKETLDTLAKFGIKIFRTDRNGRIEIDSDGLNLIIKK